jgi:anthranilate 1,2-dioxygenase small subunit
MDSVAPTIAETTRRAVEDMIYAVAHAIDDDRLEEFPNFFAEQAVYRVASRFNVERGLPMAQISCTSRGMIADRIASLRHANIFQKHRYRHLISGIQISQDADRSLAAKSSYLVVRIMDDGTSTIFSSGEYRDRIVVEDGAFRLSERLVIFDSKLIETLLVIPL